jgi:hypothetical protein
MKKKVRTEEGRGGSVHQTREEGMTERGLLEKSPRGRNSYEMSNK